MDDVLGEVGGSKRTLYDHFHGKEDLFAAIISNVSGRVLADLDVELQGDFQQDLQALGMRYLERLFWPDTLALYRAVICEAPFFPDLAKTFFENGAARVVSRLEQFFGAYNARGVIRVREPEIAAKQFAGMLRGDHHLAAALSLKKPSRKQMREIVEKAVQTLVQGAVDGIGGGQGSGAKGKALALDTGLRRRTK